MNTLTPQVASELLIEAAQIRTTTDARGFLEAGADVNASTMWGQTPLHLASRGGRPEMVLLLIHAGGNVNAQDQWGQTPLHLAVAERHADTARLLIESGADAQIKNNSQATALDLAVASGSQDIVKMLTNGIKQSHVRRFSRRSHSNGEPTKPR